MACQSYDQGPGPNAYKLPPLTGYPMHDISKWRNPAYSMGIRHASFSQKGGPGPASSIDKYTRFGKVYSPAATFGSRYPTQGTDTGPGPGAYYPKQPRRLGGAPFGTRPEPLASTAGPGPIAYNVKDNYHKRPPAFPLGVRPDMVAKHTGPGPNAYNPNRQDKVPAVKFGAAPAPVAGRDTGPGPGAHQGHQFLKFNKKANPPKFAFGVRTTNCPYVDPQDNAECDRVCRKG